MGRCNMMPGKTGRTRVTCTGHWHTAHLGFWTIRWDAGGLATRTLCRLQHTQRRG
jgi:hypothetical protein